MELLIPGLILVAIMVWASTRIKRSAAAAFEEELIETEDLVITKPDGFLHVLNDDSGLLFRAYSKEFGKIGRRDLRQANIEIERHTAISLEEVIEAARIGAESFEAEPAFIDNGEKAINARSVRVRDGAEFEMLHKFVVRGSDVIEARGGAMSEYEEAQIPKIESMLASMRLK